jgi:predicted ester cyclase
MTTNHQQDGFLSVPEPHAPRDPRPMPGDYTISLAAKGGSDRLLLSPATTRMQPMRGFEEIYGDIIDYIVRITHRIWEEKQIGYIYDTYRHNARIMGDSGAVYGRDEVVEGTIQTINAFPDMRLYADEIVWAGNDEVGFYTSHRLVITGHNTGYSRYGPPTGRKIVRWCIANCVSLENEIFEEWELSNVASTIQQLGFDLRALAREFGNQRDWSGFTPQHFGENDRLVGQNKPTRLPPAPSDRFDIEDFVRRVYHYVWNWRMPGKIDDAYSANMRFHGPTNRELYGRGAYKSFVLSLMAMFPDFVVQIDDLYWMGNEQEGYRTAVRWSLLGTHTGPGVYGKPTGRPIAMWGLTQHVIRHGRIVEEWMVFNEFEVMQQIYHD